MIGPSLKDQKDEVGREVGLRRNVYPRWVASGKLTQVAADRQIANMEAAYQTLKALAAKESP